MGNSREDAGRVECRARRDQGRISGENVRRRAESCSASKRGAQPADTVLLRTSHDLIHTLSCLLSSHHEKKVRSSLFPSVGPPEAKEGRTLRSVPVRPSFFWPSLPLSGTVATGRMRGDRWFERKLRPRH